MQRRRFIPWALAAVLTTSAIGLTACGGSDGDKAGGASKSDPHMLTMAAPSGGKEQMTVFADEVRRLSDGTLEITFAERWRLGEPLYEAGTLQDVKAGKVDMAWVGARAFDTVGVKSFQALLAPLFLNQAGRISFTANPFPQTATRCVRAKCWTCLRRSGLPQGRGESAAVAFSPCPSPSFASSAAFLPWVTSSRTATPEVHFVAKTRSSAGRFLGQRERMCFGRQFLTSLTSPAETWRDTRAKTALVISSAFTSTSWGKADSTRARKCWSFRSGFDLPAGRQPSKKTPRMRSGSCADRSAASAKLMLSRSA